MSTDATIPAEVLSDALSNALAGRTVRVALFTTYSFDPGFFELNILPLLFDYPFSQVDKVRRIQLEDTLRTVEEVAVYYDRTALAPDALPAQLDFRRIDVRRETGVFHPKIALILVEEKSSEEDAFAPESLVVGMFSANLTRAGWWENVESFHFEEISDETVNPSRCSFRRDLLNLIRRIRENCHPGERHIALRRIHKFLKTRVNRKRTRKNVSKGRYHTRIFAGQSDLPSWLEEIRLNQWDWNLEIISPFFDHESTGTLERLLEGLSPRDARIYLPREADGTALVSQTLFERAAELGVRWSTLPSGLLRPGARGAQEKASPRRVHAKVYRLWSRDAGEVILSGSVNLTAAGHSAGHAGNLEAAFLVDTSGELRLARWWLIPIESEPTKFERISQEESEGAEKVLVDISFQYDWGAETLSYRVYEDSQVPLSISDVSGRVLFMLEKQDAGDWMECGPEAARVAGELLHSTSFLQVNHPDGSWRVLVREAGMEHRPSLLTELTPEEILLYWSLLSQAQQAAFIEEKLRAEAALEGIQETAGTRYLATDTMFDRFAGLYHAFETLSRHCEESINEGRERHAVVRLFGAKYDSLPVLLKKVLDRETADPVMQYLTFLCARQLRDRLRKSYREFWKDHRDSIEVLDRLVVQLPQLRKKLPLGTEPEDVAFLDWYERMFLREAPLPEVVE